MTGPSGVPSVETACEVMHDAYEKAAVGEGWETNPASRVPWSDVPEANKATMRAAVAALLAHLAEREALVLAEARAEAWDECLRAAWWTVENSGRADLDYVRKTNPYRTAATNEGP